MTTFAPNQHALDERTREAWTAYRDGLTGLDGPDYDTAENEAWERLQDALRQIDDDRATSPTSGDPHA